MSIKIRVTGQQIQEAHAKTNPLHDTAEVTKVAAAAATTGIFEKFR
jgi:hypothetical protein